MPPAPIVPAEVDFSDPAAPRSARYDDLYHPRQGAFEQARYVFLEGNGLPARWRGRRTFTILELGFGLGNNFLATWAAWRHGGAADRAERLRFISLEQHPLRASDLARAHAGSPAPELARALCAAWPPLTPGLHRLSFEEGRLELLLGLGEAGALLREIVAGVDAFFLDGFAPARNEAMWDDRIWRALPRLAAPGATAATWSAAGVVRAGLARAGFDVTRAPGSGGKRDITLARFVPRSAGRRPARRLGDQDTSRAVVVGAGVAGAFAARALARRGLEVTVLEQARAPALAASGNPAGLVHGTFHPDDGLHARALRAAALAARLAGTQACAAGVRGRFDGLLRLDAAATDEALAAAVAASGLPPEYVQAWPAERVRAHRAAAHAAAFYPGGGWIAPAELVAWALATPGVTVRCSTPAHGLRHHEGAWSILGADGRPAASAPVVVVAGGIGAAALLAGARAGELVAAPLQVASARGQVSLLAAGTPGLVPPALPVAGQGYAIALADGRVVFGATTQPDDDEPALRATDHRHNLGVLAAVTPSTVGTDVDALVASGLLTGRVGWRATTADRLPWVGAVPAAWTGEAARAPDQARHWPRLPGLFVLAGLGGRGLTWAPLAGDLLASWILDDPFPIEASLVDALDPGRACARAVRRSRRA